MIRLPYVTAQFDAAAEALAAASGDARERLWAAHMKLHTVLPEHLPEGSLRDAFQSLHDRFTKHRRSDAHEAGVLDVLTHMDEAGLRRLEGDILALRQALHEAAATA